LTRDEYIARIEALTTELRTVRDQVELALARSDGFSAESRQHGRTLAVIETAIDALERTQQ
jgi:hypothetical protein